MPDIYIVRWKDDTHSLMFGAPGGMFTALDRIGDPSEAEVRVVPAELMTEFWLDQTPGRQTELSLDLDDVWSESRKKVWPLEALGS